MEGVGLQSIDFGLLGLKESNRERNELLSKQNELLRRISQSLDRGSKPVVKRLRILL